MVSESIGAEGPASAAPLPPRLLGGAGRRAEAWKGVSVLGDVVCAGRGERGSYSHQEGQGLSMGGGSVTSTVQVPIET